MFDVDNEALEMMIESRRRRRFVLDMETRSNSLSGPVFLRHSRFWIIYHFEGTFRFRVRKLDRYTV